MNSINKNFGRIDELKRTLNRKNVTDFAASAAFFLFLSLIPFMALVFSILPYTMLSEEMLVNLILRIFPEITDEFVAGIIGEIYDSSAGVLTVSVLLTLWSAGKAMQSMIRGLNMIGGIEENRGPLILRLLGCLYTLVLLAAMYIMVGILMFGRSITNTLLGHFPQLEKYRGHLLLLRYPVSMTLLVLLFIVIYCLVPSRKQKFMKQLPGAVFAGLVCFAASWVFSEFLNHFNAFSAYGSMAMIIILMIYMFMMMYIILEGAFLNHWIEHSKTYSAADDGDSKEGEN